MTLVNLSRLPKDEITRTILYEDQRFSYFEMQLWHTAVFQRMYNLHQLGFADKVFPDAIHSRFNHTLGVCQRAEDILVAASQNTIPLNVPMLRDFLNLNEDDDPEALRKYICSRIDVVRLMALIHDLGHIAFGHTLEDELKIFETSHDAIDRQVRMFNRITSQLIWGIYDDWIGDWPAVWSEHQQIDQLVERTEELLRLAECKEKPPELKNFRQFLVNFSAAQEAMIAMHHAPINWDSIQLCMPLLFQKLKIDAERFNIERDYFLIDAVGNTICADLLDYARRDFAMTGMVGDYDDRLFRWFVLTQYKQKGNENVRLAIKVFSDKFKKDVLREIIKILELRYDLSERVLFHPAKCCAGALLGRAMEALGLNNSVSAMLDMGDEVLLHWLDQQLKLLHRFISIVMKADGERNLEPYLQGVDEAVYSALCKSFELDENSQSQWFRVPPDRLRERQAVIRSSQGVLARLRHRHYYMVAFEVTADEDDAKSGSISEKYSKYIEQSKLVRSVESHCGLGTGTIVIHCPERDMNLKSAEVLIHYKDGTSPVPLGSDEAKKISLLNPYATRAENLAQSYRSIWKLRVYVHKASRYYLASIEAFLSRDLNVPNSSYLQEYLKNIPEYVSGKAFLDEFGGDDGFKGLASAVDDLVSMRKGGDASTFAECLDGQKTERRKHH